MSLVGTATLNESFDFAASLVRSKKTGVYEPKIIAITVYLVCAAFKSIHSHA